jgi:hypothetical protein
MADAALLSNDLGSPPSKEIMIIFLDFAGVLHPVSAGVQGIFGHLSRFEELMRTHCEIEIVISSS